MKRLITLICGGVLLINGCCFHKSTSGVTPTINAPVETPAVSAPQPQQAEQVEPTRLPLPNKQEEVTPQTAEKKDSVATAAATTSAAAIPADTPAFTNEEILPLEGRNLNPLIYKTPVSDTHLNAPWKAEQLKYGIYYSFIKAGTAYIKNRGLVDVSGRQAYLIQTTAFSAPVIDSVFKVRDVNFSWLDATNFYSLGYSQSLREGRYQRDEWVLFDYPEQTYRGELQKKAEPRGFSGLLTQPVLDMLTSLYYVRSQPLEPGQQITFDIINREEQYPLVVKVTGRQTVKTAAGRFSCLVVEPQFRGEGIFVSKGKNLKVWLTDDAYKMPVKMKTEVFIGSVSAELLEYKRN